MASHSLRKFWPAVAVLFLTLSLAGLRAQKLPLPAPHITFRDVTRAAGIHFVANNGAFGKMWLPEALGPGVAFLDYNNDGWQDILLIKDRKSTRLNSSHH